MPSALSSGDYREKIWLQFPNEENESYRMFVTYYLPQKSSRTLMTAYRKCVMTENGKTEEQANKLTGAGAKWNFWANAKDRDGNPVPDLNYSWEDRALAYWKFLYQDEVNMLLDRRGNILEQEFLDSEKMLEQWIVMYGELVNNIDYLRNQSKSAGKKFDSFLYLKQLREFIKARDEIALLIRRSVGMMDKVTEDIISQRMANNKNFQVIWSEPEVNQQHMNDVDRMSDEEFVKLIKNDLAKYDSE